MIKSGAMYFSDIISALVKPLRILTLYGLLALYAALTCAYLKLEIEA